MNNCPYCHKKLEIMTTSIVSIEIGYICLRHDHQYREYDKLIELSINNNIYYGNDIMRICSLLSFI